MANLKIEIDALAPRGTLERLETELGPQLVLKLIGARLASYADESFSTRGRGRWAVLSGNTLQLRRRGGDAPLQDSGRYRQSFVTETDGQTYVEVGSNLKTASGAPLAKIHEHGTGPFVIRLRRARVLAARTRAGSWAIFGKEVHHPGIPARPVLPGSQAEAEEILRPVLAGMLEKVVAGGPGGGA